MKLMAAVCLLAAGAAGQEVELAIPLPGALGTEAEQALRAELPPDLALRRAVAAKPAAMGSCRLWFGESEFHLARLAREGRLQRHAVPASLLPARGGEGEGRYGLLLGMPYVLAFDPGSLPPTDVPRTWTQLATLPQLEDRLGLVAFADDPVPWLAGMVHRLAAGEGESAGFALWLALDGRAGHYAHGWDELETGLTSGRFAAAILPEALCVRGRELLGLPPLARRQLDDGAPLGLLGIAIEGEPATPVLLDTIARVCQPEARRRIAARLGMQTMEATAAVGPAPDWQRAEAWLAHFERDIAGRGRTLAGLDHWLDTIFAVVFAAFLLFVWTRLRRSERSGAESP